MMQSNSQTNLFSKVLLIPLLGFVSTISLAQKTESQQLWRGVIVDTFTESIYFSNPTSGIDGVSLTTGLINWHADGADLPILVEKSLLIAQKKPSSAGKLEMAELNTTTGLVTQSETLTLPKNIQSSITDGMHHKFEIKATPNAQGNIQWQYHSQKIQGMITSEQQPKIKSTFGEIILGNSNLLRDAKLKVLTKKTSINIGAIEGNFLSGISGRQFKSVTGKTVLVSSMNPKATIWKKYSWDFYNLKGQKLGNIKFANSYRPFIIQGDLLLFVNMPYQKATKTSVESFPLLLNAYSIKSGKMVWDTEVRDFRFLGQYPQ